MVDKTFIEKSRIKILRKFKAGKQITAGSFSDETGSKDSLYFRNLLDEAFTENTTTFVRHESSHLCFFYIGAVDGMFEHFKKHFEFGYKQTDLYEATLYLNQLYLQNMRLPDVLFIDLPFDEADFDQFCANLKSNIIFDTLPIIYSEKQLTKSQLNKLHQSQSVDDIVTLHSNHIDFFSKVLFLKQSKLYNQCASGKLQKLRRQAIQIKLPAKNWSIFIKRSLDIVIALFAITALLPIFIIIALGIRIESRGPVFYAALRAGRGFKVFNFFKFRSMVTDADKHVEKLSALNQYAISDEGPKFFKINNDPRITRFGKFLRNTSADELPQLFNVLIGDMSLVGNRPLPIYEAVTLTTDEFVERFSAPAGITGLWQVNKRGKSDMSIEERINLDITYSRNCNFMYDLNILVKTPLALFQKSDV